MSLENGKAMFRRVGVFCCSDCCTEHEESQSYDVLWDGLLINQLRIFAILAQCRLQPSS